MTPALPGITVTVHKIAGKQGTGASYHRDRLGVLEFTRRAIAPGSELTAPWISALREPISGTGRSEPKPFQAFMTSR